MIKNRQETIAYIIKEARGVLDELLKHGYKVVSVDRMADIIDRIEADWKREREAGAEAAQICGEIGEMVVREASKNQSVTNCNRLGNASKMREALENIAEYAKAAECHTEDAHLLGYLNQIAMWAEAALSAPPRNCDRPECVTTKEAQEVWRKEDGGNTAYYEWLLETSTAKGETNEAYCAKEVAKHEERAPALYRVYAAV